MRICYRMISERRGFRKPELEAICQSPVLKRPPPQILLVLLCFARVSKPPRLAMLERAVGGRGRHGDRLLELSTTLHYVRDTETPF